MHLSGELAQRLLEAAPEPVLAVDAGGRIVFASRRLCSVFGYAPQALLGRRAECLLAARCREAHREHCKRLLADAAPSDAAADRLRLQGRHAQGAEFPVEISSTPVSGPDGTLILSVVRDASAEHLLTQRLALAKRSGHRLREHASHELRQPLQALNLLTAAAARQAANDSALASLAPIIEKQRDVLETLTALLRSMLDAGGAARLPPRRAEEPLPGGRSSAKEPLAAAANAMRRDATALDAGAAPLRDQRHKRR